MLARYSGCERPSLVPVALPHRIHGQLHLIQVDLFLEGAIGLALVIDAQNILRPHLRRQIVHLNSVMAGNDDGPLDHILQLANVSLAMCRTA